jgi:hypothetical protein
MATVAPDVQLSTSLRRPSFNGQAVPRPGRPVRPVRIGGSRTGLWPIAADEGGSIEGIFRAHGQVPLGGRRGLSSKTRTAPCARCSSPAACDPPPVGLRLAVGTVRRSPACGGRRVGGCA